MKTQNAFFGRIAASKRVSSLILVAASVAGLSSACAKSGALAAPAPKLSALVEKTKASAGCASFEDEFYDGLYAALGPALGPALGAALPAGPSKEKLPTSTDVKLAFEAMMNAEPRFQSLSAEDRVRARELLSELYSLLAVEGPLRFADSQKSVNYTLEAIASFEMGDRTTPAREEFMSRVTAKFGELRALFRASVDSGEVNCPKPEPLIETMSAGGLLGQWQKTRNAAVYGGLKVLATAYQSCDAGKKAALSDDTDDVRGIKVFGTHVDGVGSKRSIDNLSALLSTHPYLGDYNRPSASCFNVRGKPPIYDYGGKPFTDAGTLDLFKNAGTGTKVLGIDCSGYVYSSLATAGLKLKKSGRLKAVGVNGVRAMMWMDPQKNGLDCFDHAKFSGASSLQPGDILASGGHVILIETVGEDPFGVRGFTDESECRKENMAISRFNFTLLQSAPVKGGIGINRIRGADYLSEGGSMADAMLEHAVNACLARTGSKSVTTRAQKAGLVRHLGTSQCKDTAVKLAHEDCISSCAL